MRRWAFIVALCGMLVLLFLLNKKPIEISGSGELDELEINTRVEFSGKVVSSRELYEEVVLFVFENGIEAVCERCENYDGELLRIVGVVSEYERKKQVIVMEIFN